MIPAEEMAVVDENAAALGVPRKQLMESSGHAVATQVKDLAEPGADVAIVCGRGNNGGDAMVTARFLSAYDVTVHLLGRPESIRTAITRENWAALVAADIDCRVVGDASEVALADPEVIVDGMLGTGITGDLREPIATAAAQINACDATVVAVDVPSGVDPDTGESVSGAVLADRVVTFHDEKPGLAAVDAAVTVADIGIPHAAEQLVERGDLLRLDPTTVDGGRVFVIGGGPYTGAPALAAQAALRAGADHSFVAAPAAVANEIQGYAPDLIVQPYDGDHLAPSHVDSLVETATRYDDVVVLGPGLGQADETDTAVRSFLESFAGQVVVDADGLRAVPDVETAATVVCTPNRRELAGLGGPDAADLPAVADEIQSLAADLDAIVLAKGAIDVIADGSDTRRCRAGTPGMTVAGTGDVLAGVTAAMLVHLEPFPAACLASYATGTAAEALDADRGQGLLASDLIETLPTVLWGDRHE